MAAITTRSRRVPSARLLLATAVTLAAVFGGGAWLVWGNGPAAPPGASTVQEHTAVVPQAALTGRERGGLAALEDGRSQGWQRPPPYVVYLVENAERQQAITELGLAEGEAVLVAGTSAEHNAAQAQIERLEVSARKAPVARAVLVIDLRFCVITHAEERQITCG